MVGLAGGVDPALDALTELARCRVGGFALEQGQFLVQFLGLVFDVEQARLPVFGMYGVVGGVGIGD